jgi:hypothetical protein
VFFNWNNEKNEALKRERGVSFEQVVVLIQEGYVLDILEHPKPSQYQNQKLYIINIDNYAYVVPFVDGEGERFLKTIFPSRKYTQTYLRRNED